MRSPPKKYDSLNHCEPFYLLQLCLFFKTVFLHRPPSFPLSCYNMHSPAAFVCVTDQGIKRPMNTQKSRTGTQKRPINTHIECCIRVCDVTRSCVWHDPFICVTWLMHVCDMTHSWVCPDSCMCVTWLSRMCGVTYSCVWHDASTCVTWLLNTSDMTLVYMWHDAFISLT